MTAATLVGILCALVAGAAVLGGAPPRRLPRHKPIPDPAGSPPGEPPRRRGRLALVTFGVLVLATAGPLLAVVVGVGGVTLWVLRRRVAVRRREEAVADQLPDVVDLLRLTTLAGLPVSAAFDVIGARPGGPLGEAIEHAVGKVRYGASTADALDALRQETGPPTRGLVEALTDHVRYGSPLGPALDRVAIEARLRRRRRAEEAARRLPVTLLFPLVFTTVPSLLLLVVVPILTTSLSALPI